MVTIACVLRSGGDFSPLWVYRLRAHVSRHLPVPHRFFCLTDTLMDLDCAFMEHGWPKWWPKLELFKPGLFDGPVVYMDLDTLPVGDLTDIASYRGPFAMISDFYRPKNAQSGVMAWTPGPVTESIWQAFMRNPQQNMQKYRGDGEFIAAHSKPDRLQALFPGQIVSLKREGKKGPPPDARLVCGHGRPRFTDARAGWAHEAWKKAA